MPEGVVIVVLQEFHHPVTIIRSNYEGCYPTQYTSHVYYMRPCDVQY